MKDEYPGNGSTIWLFDLLQKWSDEEEWQVYRYELQALACAYLV